MHKKHQVDWSLKYNGKDPMNKQKLVLHTAYSQTRRIRNYIFNKAHTLSLNFHTADKIRAIAFMMEAVSTFEMTVSTRLHGTTSQKTVIFRVIYYIQCVTPLSELHQKACCFVIS
jgi:hypothetical protein